MTEGRQIGFVEVNGTKLYYEAMGQGHPLVWLHGGYMDMRMWDDQFAVFAERYQVIRYDIRGFGKTDMPQVPYSDVQDLYELLKHLQIEKAYLLGLSLGGMIAIDFTLEHSDMVDALVLVGAAVGGVTPQQMYTEEQLQEQIQRWEPFQKAVRERNVPQMVEILMNHPTLVPPPKYASAHQHVRENLSEYSFVYVLDPAPKQEIVPPAWERLREIHIPTLIVVGGDDDIALHLIADKFEQDIVCANRITIPETHHMPNLEKPEEFNAIVLEFLSEL